MELFPWEKNDNIHNFTGLLTKKFINLVKHAEDGILDLNKAAETLEVPLFFRKNVVTKISYIYSSSIMYEFIYVFLFHRCKRGGYTT